MKRKKTISVPNDAKKVKIKFKKAKKRFTRQQSRGKTPPLVKGGANVGANAPDGNFFKKKYKADPKTGKTTGKYSKPQKFVMKRKADRVDARPLHTWAKHDKYVQGQQTLKQLKEKHMGTRKGDKPHTLKYKRAGEMTHRLAYKKPEPEVGVAQGVPPAQKRKRKTLLAKLKSAGKMGSGLRFKAFKKERG